MSLRFFIISILLCTVLCWLAWVLILLRINPYDAGVIGFLLFYTSLFLALVGTFSLAGLGMRRICKRHELQFRQVPVSFRQGVWFALFLVIMLFLQSQDMLTAVNVFLFIMAHTVIELFFLSRNGKAPKI